MTYTPVFCPPLTRREYEVLLIMDTWLTNREIGMRLGVTENTVKTHIRAIYRKLGVTSRREAVDKARTAGIRLLGE